MITFVIVVIIILILMFVCDIYQKEIENYVIFNFINHLTTLLFH